MKRTLLRHASLALSLSCAILPAVAAVPPGAQINTEEVEKAASAMVIAYRAGNIAGMLALEKQCWDEVAGKPPGYMKTATICVTAGFAGYLLEAAIANSEGRGPRPQYSGSRLAERIVAGGAKVWLTRSQMNEIYTEVVAPHAADVLSGFMSQGVR